MRRRCNGYEMLYERIREEEGFRVKVRGRGSLRVSEV
jgi:hypothetical protein